MAKWVDVKFNMTPIQRYTRTKTKAIRELPQRALDFFVAQTPVDTGHARRSTHLKGKNDATIHANYPYAQKLDDGHSQQAPKGMTEPTKKWIEREYKKIFGKK